MSFTKRGVNKDRMKMILPSDDEDEDVDITYDEIIDFTSDQMSMCHL